MLAATVEKEETIRFLVKSGADINARTADGGTVLSFVKKNGLGGMVDVLTSLGAEE